MGRHITDHATTATGDSRVENFARIEREAKPNPNAKALQRRAKDHEKSKRVEKFVGIERSSDS